MRLPHLAEVMDQRWPPAGLQATMREILECGNSWPFRQYYQWVADEVEREVLQGGYEHIVELGAGTAPISRLLARAPGMNGVKLIVCDDHPDAATYADLKRQYPGRVVPIYHPVDFSHPHSWPPRTLLVLSGSFHHVPPDRRPRVLKTLGRSGDRVMICEPLRKSVVSMSFVPFSAIPALILPLWFFSRPGKLRRFLWCWLLPAAPVIFWWDGLVSCLRMWSDEEWCNNLQAVFGERVCVKAAHSLFCQMVVWAIHDPRQESRTHTLQDTRHESV